MARLYQKPGPKNPESFDRGHQAPLAIFKNTDYWEDTNYYSNITPQKSGLNQGIWRSLELRILQLSAEVGEVYVYTGPHYEREMVSLPNAQDKEHSIPSGYWKIVIVPSHSNPLETKCASFIFDQDTPYSEKNLLTDTTSGSSQTYLTTIDEIEAKTEIDFLWKLPDDIEKHLELNDFFDFAEEYLDEEYSWH